MKCNSSICLCLLLVLLTCHLEGNTVAARVRDLCQVKPSTNGLCVPTTVGIFYDPETQKCHFMGCSNKKLFATLEDCEKICNNKRHTLRRMHQQTNKTNETTN